MENGNAPPPWMQVPPEMVIDKLLRRNAVLTQELVMKDAYIDQLHAALADLAKESSAQPQR